jgi:hypothetical protein
MREKNNGTIPYSGPKQTLGSPESTVTFRPEADIQGSGYVYCVPVDSKDQIGQVCLPRPRTGKLYAST